VGEDVRSRVLELEEERCRCIVEQRFDRLRELLSERLVHTHTRGNVDGRDSYLAYISGVIETLELRREELQVLQLSDSSAVLHGRQISRARRRGTDEEVRVEAMVTQAFAREADGQWRLVAFQATPLGPAPPAIART
jgi:ketosteroid isomerase-like protein